MTSFDDMGTTEQVESLSVVVGDLLVKYGLSGATFESINHGYNSTFRVDTARGQKFALRVNVNSQRSSENLNAEVHWINAIKSVKTPRVIAAIGGGLWTSAFHEASGRHLNAVLFSWLEGEELGDEPSISQLQAAGEAMALLHRESVGFVLPDNAQLPDLEDFFAGANDLLLSNMSQLSDEEKHLVLRLQKEFREVFVTLGGASNMQVIHADMHPWNLMWHDGKIAVFDFDDCAIGLAVQDLAIALYYLDTDEQEAALLEGYRRVAALPKFSQRQMQTLKHQRRMLLLNYLFESTTPEHKEMLPTYRSKAFGQLREFMAA